MWRGHRRARRRLRPVPASPRTAAATRTAPAAQGAAATTAARPAARPAACPGARCCCRWGRGSRRREGGQRVERHPGPQRRGLARDRVQRHRADGQHRQQRAQLERLGSALREGDGQRHDRRQRRDGDSDARQCGPQAPVGQQRTERVAGRGQGGEQRRHRAAQGGEERESGAGDRQAAVQGDHRAQRGQRAEGQGQPPGVEVDRGGGAEGDGAQPGPRAEVTAGEPREQRGRGRGGESGGELRREQGRDGREQDAVAQDVVAAVPVVVPQPEALLVKQAGAEQVRRQIPRGRRDDHVGGGQHRRDGDGRVVAPAPPASLAPRGGLRARGRG